MKVKSNKSCKNQLEIPQQSKIYIHWNIIYLEKRCECYTILLSKKIEKQIQTCWTGHLEEFKSLIYTGNRDYVIPLMEKPRQS